MTCFMSKFDLVSVCYICQSDVLVNTSPTLGVILMSKAEIEFSSFVSLDIYLRAAQAG